MKKGVCGGGGDKTSEHVLSRLLPVSCVDLDVDRHAHQGFMH